MSLVFCIVIACGFLVCFEESLRSFLVFGLGNVFFFCCDSFFCRTSRMVFVQCVGAYYSWFVVILDVFREWGILRGVKWSVLLIMYGFLIRFWERRDEFRVFFQGFRRLIFSVCGVVGGVKFFVGGLEMSIEDRCLGKGFQGRGFLGGVLKYQQEFLKLRGRNCRYFVGKEILYFYRIQDMVSYFSYLWEGSVW